MTRVVLDPATLAKLSSVQDRAEVCDAQGLVRGYFTPVPELSDYKGIQIPLSEAELERAEQETDSYTTAEVLAYLEKL